MKGHTCAKRPKGTKRKPCKECAGQARFIASLGFTPPQAMLLELKAVEESKEKR